MKIRNDCKGKQVIKTFKKLGFEIMSQTKHVRMKKDNITLAIPMANKIIAKGTLRSLIKQSQVDIDLFYQYL